MSCRVLPFNSDNLKLAADALRAGDVVGAPTETVYGLAGLVFNACALAKIFAVKDRPTFDPLIVHVAVPSRLAGERDWIAALDEQEIVDASRLSSEQRQVAGKLASAFWPGPLSLVLPKHESVPDLATAGLPTVAVRAPARPAMQELICAAGGPLAAPSANRFGGISPTRAGDVLSELGNRISFVLDDGPCEIGLESTIVSIQPTGDVELLRPGAVTVDNLQNALGKTGLKSAEPKKQIIAPGSLPSHYAPRKPLLLLPAPLSRISPAQVAQIREDLAGQGGVGLLAQRGKPEEIERHWRSLFAVGNESPTMAVRSLSAAGNVVEAARNLFRMLRELDDHPATRLLVAEPVESQVGLGHAIADRLSRATAAKFSSSQAVKHSPSV